MRVALVIAAKDLRQRLRDRSAIVLAFVAPLVIALLISLAFQSAESFHAHIGLVDLDRGPVAAALTRALQQPQLRQVVSAVPVAGEDDAAHQVRSGTLDAALVIPKGFSEEAVGGTPAQLQVLASVDRRIAAQVVAAIADNFDAQVNADRISVLSARAAGARQTMPELARSASALRLPVSVVQQAQGNHPLKVISYYAPGMAIFFLLFSIGLGARSYFTELRDGTLDRIAVAPVGPLTVLAGKAASIFVFGAGSMAVMVVVTTVFFGADWGSPAAVTAVCAAMILSVVALTAMVITLSRTDRQAEALASIVTFGLALIGGNFVFVSASPPLMRRLALLTPNGWALRAFIDLSTGSGQIRDAVVPIVAILALTAIVALVAATRARDRIVR